MAEKKQKTKEQPKEQQTGKKPKGAKEAPVKEQAVKEEKIAPRLFEKYKKDIIPDMMKRFSYKKRYAGSQT